MNDKQYSLYKFMTYCAIDATVEFPNIEKLKKTRIEDIEPEEFGKVYYAAWIVSLLCREAISKDKEDDEQWTSMLLFHLEHTSRVINGTGEILNEKQVEAIIAGAKEVFNDYRKTIDLKVKALSSSEFTQP